MLTSALEGRLLKSRPKGPRFVEGLRGFVEVPRGLRGPRGLLVVPNSWLRKWATLRWLVWGRGRGKDWTGGEEVEDAE